jgi:cytochrome c oxidase subunit 2
MISQLFSLLAQSELVDKYSNNGIRPEGSSYWFAEQASTIAADVDFLYMAIFWISTVFFAIIIGLMCYFVVKYRRRPGVNPEPSTSHNTALEIFWSVVPSIILVWIFWEGARGFLDSRFAPEDAEEILVTGKKWDWTFTYPDGDQSAELHLVLDRPVKLVLWSEDVLHSFFISAFRQKMDVVPGRFTYAWVNPTKPGVFRVACTEYCGENHSWMRTWCHVHVTNDERKANTQWIESEHKPWENGDRHYKMHCAGCHNINGIAATGPALDLIWGTEEKLIDGTTIKVDENYVLDSLKDPNKQVVAGYGPVSKMQTFQGKLDDNDINDIIAFLKRLRAEDKDKFDAEQAAEQAKAKESDPAAEKKTPDGDPSKETSPPDGAPKSIEQPDGGSTTSPANEKSGGK